jgi:hypothetical protein
MQFAHFLLAEEIGYFQFLVLEQKFLLFTTASLKQLKPIKLIHMNICGIFSLKLKPVKQLMIGIT